MKRILLFSLFCISACNFSYAQRNCGQQLFYQHLEEIHPGAIARAKAIRDQSGRYGALLRTAQGAGPTAKTTDAPLIPVIFHVVLDSVQLKQIGGTAGIEERIQTQLRALNTDYNALNADSSKIPAVWKPLFAKMGIRFGMAKLAPDGSAAKGYEIRIVPAPSRFTDVIQAAARAKSVSTGGMDPWDNTRYLNVWIIYMKQGAGEVLGVTAPPDNPDFPKEQTGIALNYLAFGVRTSVTQAFIAKIDQGRTLTHEMGHFFHLWHTWGDDGGACPGDGTGSDDGIADTPPEADAEYGDPSYPVYDACSPAGTHGIMFMNYMDYTNDKSMNMFTQDQKDVVQGQIAFGGPSYTITQHPELAEEPVDIPKDVIGSLIQVRPNPSTGVFQIKYDPDTNKLLRIAVYNSVGQIILTNEDINITSVDLSEFSKGMYILRCWFEGKIITEKIVLR